MSNLKYSAQFGCCKCSGSQHQSQCHFSVLSSVDPSRVPTKGDGVIFDKCPAGGKAEFKLIAITEIDTNEQEAGEAKADEDQSG